MTTTAPAVAGDGPDIVCQDLVRIFSTEGVEVQALQGLTLRVDRGDVVAIVGASGSGKSTLLSILSGLDRPTGGSAIVAGTDLGTMSRAARVRFQRHTVGFVWQQTSRNLLPYLTAAQNIAVPLVLAGAAARAARVDELLEVLGIEHCRDRRPEQLSGGEQQRTAIAVALANSPRVLLADEPTGELDDATSAEVLDALRSASERLGVTVLIVTHDPTVSEHVRRTVQIRDGRTSTEVLRRTEVDHTGTEVHVAEEFAVMDRAGRLQLPEEFVSALELRDRVRLALETDHVGVWPDGARRAGDDGPGLPATPSSGTGRPSRRTLRDRSEENDG
ncbi:ABC transporter ATP-binding protein [Georgenia sp. MJ170]|uniref:ABC transporter ATP-binding protein n=1 Tax=Georgenia sunbinii TaxID=3117728 RepID=UPI002F262905